MSDFLWLLGVSCRCRIGVPDWERKKAQTILVDVGLELDLRKPGKSDDLRDALDYAELEKRIRAASGRGEFRLLERLAEELAALALALAPQARSVTIRARKRPVVMPKTREVVAEIRRARARPRSS